MTEIMKQHKPSKKQFEMYLNYCVYGGERPLSKQMMICCLHCHDELAEEYGLETKKELRERLSFRHD